MEDDFIDYRGDCWIGIKDLRNRLKMARSGQTFSFICEEDQISRILRVIVYNDGAITNRMTKEDGVFITVRKT